MGNFFCDIKATSLHYITWSFHSLESIAFCVTLGTNERFKNLHLRDSARENHLRNPNRLHLSICRSQLSNMAAKRKQYRGASKDLIDTRQIFLSSLKKKGENIHFINFVGLINASIYTNNIFCFFIQKVN